MKNLRAALLMGGALVLASCGQSGTTSQGPATAAEADKFVEELNADIKRMLPALSAAQWVSQTYITDDTQLISAKANEEFLAWQARRIEESKRFNDVKDLKPETARAL